MDTLPVNGLQAPDDNSDVSDPADDLEVIADDLVVMWFELSGVAVDIADRSSGPADITNL